MATFVTTLVRFVSARQIAIPWEIQPYPPTQASVGDTLVFTGTPFHTLYIMPTLADFEKCKFLNAQDIPYISISANENEGVYTITEEDFLNKVVYFGCSYHCFCCDHKIRVAITEGSVYRSYSFSYSYSQSFFDSINIHSTSSSYQPSSISHSFSFLNSASYSNSQD
jgi:hypothetical protein